MADYIPLQQQAYNTIREMIADGRLETGRCYSEKKIAADMGISRTPVRDAILRLGQDRYIDIIPSKGFCLHVMNREDIWNTFQARTAVEGFCAVYLHQHRNDTAAKASFLSSHALSGASYHASGDAPLSGSGSQSGASYPTSGDAPLSGSAAIHALEQNLAEMETRIRSGESFSSILTCDFAFHRILVRSCGNQDLENIMDSYHHRLSDIAFRSFEQQGRPLEALEEHGEILRNLQSDDPDAEASLYRSVMRHMEASRDIALRLMKE